MSTTQTQTEPKPNGDQVTIESTRGRHMVILTKINRAEGHYSQTDLVLIETPFKSFARRVFDEELAA
jgi:hypothetical protein